MADTISGSRAAVSPSTLVRLPGVAFLGWYSDWVTRTQLSGIDLLIPVANEFGVRADVGAATFPLVVHATTSRLWQAQLHEHVAGMDDCIGCRFRHLAHEPSFGCSEGTVAASQLEEPEESEDAALPFLSAGAGALLLGSLLRLSAGQPRAGRANLHAVRLQGRRVVSSAVAPPCVPGCTAARTTADMIMRLPYGHRWHRLLLH